MPRRLIALVMIALLGAACSYESSGTTTTTIPLVEEEPVPTGPADLEAVDQRSEGSSVLVSSLSMPAAGWVVARMDSAGSPGEVIGISELVSKGVIADVDVPLLLPIATTTTVHLTVHIDVDGDGEFRYEPPDGFVDQIATQANGDAATVVVEVALLPPLGPASALLDEQRSDGTAVVVAGGLLPAPGFLVLHEDDGGEPGAVLAVSGLLPAGEVGAATLLPDPPLAATGSVFVVAWVDRNENGEFDPGVDGDEMAVTEDGTLAAAVKVVTVLRREPAALVVSDQQVDDQFVITAIEMPSPGFIEILGDASGSPGVRLAVVDVAPGTADDVTVALPAGVRNGTRLWLRLWIDADASGDLSAADTRALTEVGGDPVEVSFVVTR